jgi:hypothetical protein
MMMLYIVVDISVWREERKKLDSHESHSSFDGGEMSWWRVHVKTSATLYHNEAELV